MTQWRASAGWRRTVGAAHADTKRLGAIPTRVLAHKDLRGAAGDHKLIEP